jgi:hypothetical protein
MRANNERERPRVNQNENLCEPKNKYHEWTNTKIPCGWAENSQNENKADFRQNNRSTIIPVVIIYA